MSTQQETREDDFGATSPGSDTRRPRKSRVNLACKRCKGRKQRCDGRQPVCKSCEKVGIVCVYEKVLRPQYPGGKTLHINALEERIAFLESRLPDYADDHLDHRHVNHSNTLTGPQPADLSRRSSTSEDPEVDDRSSLVDGVAYLSLCASGTTDRNFEPYYLGSSSGASIAHVIQSSIFRNARKEPRLDEAAALQSTPIVSEDSASEESALSDELIPDLPDRQTARMLFDVFFDRIHTRWPLLDRAHYTSVFDQQYLLGAVPLVERSIFHLIYAITSRFLTLTRKTFTVDSEKHLKAATLRMDFIVKQHNLGTVQFLLLLGVHGQRSPYGAGAWSQVRYATSVCIELGLHREKRQRGPPERSRETELRRRAFWSCYCLDRATSIVLGRAFAIADKDINAELPSVHSDFRNLTHDETENDSLAWSNVEPFIHMIRLDKLHSRTTKAVFRVDKDVFKYSTEERLKLDRKMAAIRSDLDAWIQSCPKTPKDGNKVTWMYDPESAYLDSRDFYNLQYHKALLLLFTMFLPTLDTADARFITCAHSAAEVCIAYKRLNQNRTLTYTMISLHSCFVAGLTLVYCAWRDRSFFSYEAFNACAQSLTIFGEKWPGAVKYRDIFDALSSSLFKSIVAPITSVSHRPEHSHSHPIHPPRDPRRRPSGNAEENQRAPQTPFVAHQVSSDPTNMSGFVSDAVREAFMEVDGEAPGGWQGWRMWNEMVMDEPSQTVASTSGSANAGYAEGATNWSGLDHSGFDFSSMDPVQAMAYGQHNTGNSNIEQWQFDNY